jgi:inosine-uridine nucleoside N-ribohydrolase
MAHKIIIDTDIGEDIDDILVAAFALVSPEFDVLAITVTDCDVHARSRIARKLLQVVGQPDVLVGRGYAVKIPSLDRDGKPNDGMSQTDLAPDETGLQPESPLPADELIASIAAEHPGEVTLATIGMMSNAAQAFLRYPDAAKLKQVATNGGNFGPGRKSSVGWNMRYDPVAAAILGRAPVPWVLLPENSMSAARLRDEDVQRLAESDHALPRLLTQAIDLWRVNKHDLPPGVTPHLSDLNTLAWLMGWLEADPGAASITVSPRGKGGLSVEFTSDGPHLLGRVMPEDKGREIRQLLMDRILSSEA